MEGSIAAQYFGVYRFDCTRSGALMRPDGRNRRPPRDRCNALLSFGYALLLKDVTPLVVGLDPALAFISAPSQAHPLL
jgi:CRISPR-associated protein Cas1